MKKTSAIIGALIMLLASNLAAQENTKPINDYLGQTPPGDEPQVFARGVISVDGKNTHGLRFSPDGSLLIFSRYPDGSSFQMVRSQTGWSQPVPTSFKGKEVSFDPLLKRIFYYNKGDLYFVHYGPDGFSSPTKLPAVINTAEIEYYPNITAHRNLYFSMGSSWKTARVQVAKLQGEGFGDPIDLREPINAGGASHALIAPDESYMLFNSPRAGSYTQNDIWVSFRNQDGSWATPANLGPRINRDAKAVLCPTLSPDGKYLFFTRFQEDNTGLVYWVSTGIIEKLRANANIHSEPKRGSAPDGAKAVTQSRSLPSQASFQGLGDFPGGTFESSALRVSADGSVVVGYGTSDSGKQAFRWTQSEDMVSLGNLSDHSFKQSQARGVSADGSVIVGDGNPVGTGSDSNQGFRWTQNGGMVKVGSLDGSARYEALGVSADGSVVVGDGGPQAFRWVQNGSIAGLGVLPGRTNSRAIAVSADGLVVVGSSYNLPSWNKEEAFVWTQAGGMQGLGYLPSGSTSFPNAVSADGSVIVGTSSSSSGYAAFRWTRDTGMVSIGHLPGGHTTHPGGITADGSIIVGGSFVDRDHGTAFIWDAAHGMRSLQSVLETDYGLNLVAWNLQYAFDITPDGSVIVGSGKNPSGQQEAFRVTLSAPPANKIAMFSAGSTKLSGEETDQ